MYTKRRLRLALRVLPLFIWVANPVNALWLPWAVSVFFVGVGIYWGVVSSNGDNFARMGSAIVIISTTTYFSDMKRFFKVASHDLEKKFEEIVLQVMDISVFVNSQSNYSDPEKMELNDIGREIGKKVNDFGVVVSNIDPKKLDRQYAIHAFFMLILGTSIWGFGDLFFD